MMAAHTESSHEISFPWSGAQVMQMRSPDNWKLSWSIQLARSSRRKGCLLLFCSAKATMVIWTRAVMKRNGGMGGERFSRSLGVRACMCVCRGDLIVGCIRISHPNTSCRSLVYFYYTIWVTLFKRMMKLASVNSLLVTQYNILLEMPNMENCASVQAAGPDDLVPFQTTIPNAVNENSLIQ